MEVSQKSSKINIFLKENKIILLILFFYSIVLFVGILHHEMWRDELQAWLIAKSSSSLIDLFQNIKYETHPFLWYLPLWLISKFTANPFGMQVFHFLIAVINAFLILKFAPFKIYQKVMMIFGYYFLFEYSIISRNYSIGILFCLLFMVIYSKYGVKRPFLSFACLSLAALSNLCSLILSVALAGMYVFSSFKHNNFLKRLFLSFVYGLVVLLSLSEIVITADGSYGLPPVSFLSVDYLISSISHVFLSCFYCPFFTLNFWNSNILCIILPMSIIFCFSVFLISFFVVVSKKCLPYLFFFCSSLVGLLVFFYYSRYFLSRGLGFLFLTVFFVIWFLINDERVNLLYKKIAINLVSIMLIFQFIGGIFAFYTDIKYPFSGAKETTSFLSSSPTLKVLPMVGWPDSSASSVAAYLNTKMYYFEQLDLGDYVKWTKKRSINSDRLNDKIILDQLFYAVKSGGSVIFVTTSNCSPIPPIFFSRPSIVPDERFFVYLINNSTESLIKRN